MPQPFNPTHAVRFELGRGRVTAFGTEPRVLVPADALGRLCESAGEHGASDFGRRMGTEIGRRVAERVSSNASLPEMVEHLGGDLALAGLGSLGVEVWGRALVMTVEGSPLGSHGDVLLASVLEGAVQRALARDVAVVPIDRQDARVRLLVVSPQTAASVRDWLKNGVSWGDALTRLNTPSKHSG